MSRQSVLSDSDIFYPPRAGDPDMAARDIAQQLMQHAERINDLVAEAQGRGLMVLLTVNDMPSGRPKLRPSIFKPIQAQERMP